MTHASGNPPWQDYPNLTTPVTAGTLEHVEALLDRLLNPPAFSASQNTAQSLPSGVATVLKWDRETIDTHNGHDTVTNNTRYTVPTGWAGIYFVTTQMMLGDFVGRRAIWILKNGTPLPASLAEVPQVTTAQPGLQRTVRVSKLVPAVPGDYIEAQGFQDNPGGVAQTLVTSAGTTAGDFSSGIDLFYVRP